MAKLIHSAAELVIFRINWVKVLPFVLLH